MLLNWWLCKIFGVAIDETNTKFEIMNFSKISFNKVLLIPLLLVVFSNTLFSQQNDSIRTKGMFLGLSFGPSQTKIENSGIYSFSAFTAGKEYTFGGSAEIGYYLSKHWGISSGIGYDSYHSQVALSSYQNKFNTIDSEKEAYEMRVTGNGINENQKISYLTVPVCLNFRLPIGNSFGLILKTGLQIGLALEKSYTSTGTFSYRGYYPAYNVLLENLPAYGFVNDQNSSVKGQLAVKPITFFALAAAGFDVFLEKKYQIAVVACYNKSISEVSAYASNIKYQFSPEAGQINSFLGGSSKAAIHSMGISFSLRYFLSK